MFLNMPYTKSFKNVTNFETEYKNYVGTFHNLM
jgi:hypothetical protein